MTSTLKYPPFVKWRSGIQGLVAGSMLVSGVITPFGAVIQIILFAAGVFVFIDSFMPEGHASTIMTTFAGVVGGLISVFSVLFSFEALWSIFTVIVAVLFYFFGRRRIFKDAGKNSNYGGV